MKKGIFIIIIFVIIIALIILVRISLAGQVYRSQLYIFEYSAYTDIYHWVMLLFYLFSFFYILRSHVLKFNNLIFNVSLGIFFIIFYLLNYDTIDWLSQHLPKYGLMRLDVFEVDLDHIKLKESHFIRSIIYLRINNFVLLFFIGILTFISLLKFKKKNNT